MGEQNGLLSGGEENKSIIFAANILKLFHANIWIFTEIYDQKYHCVKSRKLAI